MRPRCRHASLLAASLLLAAGGAYAAGDDFDGIPPAIDNCPNDFNPDQLDGDCDGLGDICDFEFIDTCGIDTDGDGVPDGQDNCPGEPNPSQNDADMDGVGNACEAPPPPDADGDGVADSTDNCPAIPNPGQADADSDGVGDACEGNAAVDPTSHYYDFEEGTVDTAASGPGSVLDTIDDDHGTPSGDPTYRSDVPANPIPRTGRANNLYLELDGSGDSVTVIDPDSADPLSTEFTGPFTVEFWMRGDDGASPDNLFVPVEASHGAIDSKGWVFQGGSSGGLLGFLVGLNRGGTSDFVGVAPPTSVLTGEWFHLAGVYDTSAAGTEIAIYLDGVWQATASVPQPYEPSRRDINFGLFWNGGNPARYFDGDIDEIRFSEAALCPVDFLNAPPRVFMPRDLDGNPHTVEAWYDTILEILWLADPNLPRSRDFGVPGIAANGDLDWNTAQSFIAAMNAALLGNGYLGINTWQLPEASPVDMTAFKTGPGNFTNNASTDEGTASRRNGWNWEGCEHRAGVSQLGYLFYVHLEGEDACAADPDPATCNATGGPVGLGRYRKFGALAAELNAGLTPRQWWSGASVTSDALAVDFQTGIQAAYPKNTSADRRAWPVSLTDAPPATRQMASSLMHTPGGPATVSGGDTPGTGHKAVFLDNGAAAVTDLTLIPGPASGVTLHVIDRGALTVAGDLTMNAGSGLNTSGPNAASALTGNNASLAGALIAEAGGTVDLNLNDGGGGMFTYGAQTAITARGPNTVLTLEGDATGNPDLTLLGELDVLNGATLNIRGQKGNDIIVTADWALNVDDATVNFEWDFDNELDFQGDVSVDNGGTFDFTGNGPGAATFSGSFDLAGGAVNNVSLLGIGGLVATTADFTYAVAGAGTQANWNLVATTANFNGTWDFSSGAQGFVNGSIDEILYPTDWTVVVAGATTALTMTLDVATSLTIASDFTVNTGGVLNLSIPATAAGTVQQLPASNVLVDGQDSVLNVTHEGSGAFSFGDGDVVIQNGGKFVSGSIDNI